MDGSFSQKDIIASGKFMLGILALFLAFGFVFSLIPLEWFELAYAHATLAILKVLGFSGEVIAQEPALIELSAFSSPIGISYLCTGLLELTIVWSALLASFGIELKKRLIGVGAATVVIVVFNLARIVASILIISSLGFDAGNFSHDVLFRLFLFATISGFYYFWFVWATSPNAKRVHKKRASG